MLRLAFFFILLLFFARSQSDVLSLLFSWMAGRPLHVWPWITALLLAAAGAWGAGLLRRLRLSEFGGCLSLAWLYTSVVSLPFCSWPWLVLLFAAAALLIWGDRWLTNWWQMGHASVAGVWPHFAPVLLRLLVLCLYLGLGAAASDTDHYELRTAQAIRTNHPKRGWQTGAQSLATTPRLFALRCFLMATTRGDGGLGNKLFEQPVPANLGQPRHGGGSELLVLPDDERQRLTLPPSALADLLGAPRRRGETALAWFGRCAQNGNRIAVDYYLCGLLLDRRLDDFAHAVIRYYPAQTRRGSLPTYYAQALLLYTRLRTQPAVVYNDAASAENLRDYIAMGDTLPDRTVRCNNLRRQYGETYWWWYEYAE